MEQQAEPLLKYAEELLHSYSRLIVYSGDILRSLPEPREGLSVANIKPKKDESTAFQREWQHLESVFDEYLIRLNDIRTRAHEELEAARVKCLVGENIDLTLPEAAVKLGARLAKYKRQYDFLQQVVSGGSIEDLEKEKEKEKEGQSELESQGESDGVVPTGEMDVDAGLAESTVEGMEPAPETDEPLGGSPEDMIHDGGTPAMVVIDDEEEPAVGEQEGEISQTENVVMSSNVNTPVQSVEPGHSISVDVADDEVGEMDFTSVDPIDVDAESDPDAAAFDGETIELESGSNIDDDEDMEDIFQ
ncbi:hypothetical protein GGI03_002631 [Coemansia sp. RSA 2337]|nr:hypothetical protein H4S03_006728 [Coemansia sp. S3946]KAJ2045248.1 hypothetical protein H4S04_005753 [Coemansia sp. S16]KAJ2066224.1 hypothetical protein GGI08_001974 [Coemansia sp. S2]KAJ2111290.1 hypothetical protein IW146_005459 [Coemansia sp. RSA 922]KAJ2465501.1 hypothetical protein GGI03_002631 [Coemansia sp. RSA 2337]